MALLHSCVSILLLLFPHLSPKIFQPLQSSFTPAYVYHLLQTIKLTHVLSLLLPPTPDIKRIFFPSPFLTSQISQSLVWYYSLNSLCPTRFHHHHPSNLFCWPLPFYFSSSLTHMLKNVYNPLHLQLHLHYFSHPLLYPFLPPP